MSGDSLGKFSRLKAKRKARKISDQKPVVRDQGECGGRCASAPVAGATLSHCQRDTIENTLMPEPGCGFISYEADGEGVMRRECPEFGGAVVGERTGSKR